MRLNDPEDQAYLLESRLHMLVHGGDEEQSIPCLKCSLRTGRAPTLEGLRLPQVALKPRMRGVREDITDRTQRLPGRGRAARLKDQIRRVCERQSNTSSLLSDTEDVYSLGSVYSSHKGHDSSDVNSARPPSSSSVSDLRYEVLPSTREAPEVQAAAEDRDVEAPESVEKNCPSETTAGTDTTEEKAGTTMQASRTKGRARRKKFKPLRLTDDTPKEPMEPSIELAFGLPGEPRTDIQRVRPDRSYPDRSCLDDTGEKPLAYTAQVKREQPEINLKKDFPTLGKDTVSTQSGKSSGASTKSKQKKGINIKSIAASIF